MLDKIAGGSEGGGPLGMLDKIHDMATAPLKKLKGGGGGENKDVLPKPSEVIGKLGNMAKGGGESAPQ